MRGIHLIIWESQFQLDSKTGIQISIQNYYHFFASLEQLVHWQQNMFGLLFFNCVQQRQTITEKSLVHFQISTAFFIMILHTYFNLHDECCKNVIKCIVTRKITHNLKPFNLLNFFVFPIYYTYSVKYFCTQLFLQTVLKGFIDFIRY